MMTAAAAAAITGTGAAGTAIGTPDALLPILFGPVDRSGGGNQDDGQNTNHNQISNRHDYFTPLNAYSRFKLCSDLMHR